MKKFLIPAFLFLSAGLAFGQSSGLYNATTYAYTTQVTAGNTSIGRFPRVPSAETILFEPTRMTNFFAEAATIFSRTKARP